MVFNATFKNISVISWRRNVSKIYYCNIWCVQHGAS